MRNIASGVLAVAAAVTVWTFAPAGGRETNYVQIGCEVSESYFAYIYMVPESDIGKPNARKYSVEFNPERILVRFRPAYYALKWDETTVSIEYRGDNSDDAILSFRKYGFSADTRPRVIGQIRRDCWERVKAYIGRNVHAPVHIVEMVSGV
jgi:hypothetical protein